MFVGHYGVALAAKPLSPRTSLGWTFLAVQLLDVIWAPLILLGVEHARVVPGFLPASPLVLYDMPWTHSLLAAVAWAWLTFRLSKNAVLGGCVFSHWVLDWISHRPDLPLYRGGPVVGLGLWQFRTASFLVEALFLLAGLAVYLRATRARVPAARYAMPAFAALLIAIEAANIWGPAPMNIRAVAVIAELCFLAFAAVAYALDRLRASKPAEPPVRLNLSDSNGSAPETPAPHS